MDIFKSVERDLPGYLNFLSDLKVGNKIKFNNLKIGSSIPEEKIIEILSREEPGRIGKSAGLGLIEYTSDDSQKISIFETFLTIKELFKNSDSYEVLKKAL